MASIQRLQCGTFNSTVEKKKFFSLFSKKIAQSSNRFARLKTSSTYSQQKSHQPPAAEQLFNFEWMIVAQRNKACIKRRNSHLNLLRQSKATISYVTESAQAVASLQYEAVVFDMDGTLTVSNIDFEDMRIRTGIPVGDLFTVMETWDDSTKVDKAYEVILELEANACKNLEIQPGLIELLELLRSRGAKVALVTRNTTISVNAFFAKIGEEWRDTFSILLTREFRFVKPDKRLLLHVAEQWALPPSYLLMVGDSREDVECGNAAGTATCFIQGGGNEVVSGTAPTGAEPTFSVSTLMQLKEILMDTNASVEHESSVEFTIPGLAFTDSLFSTGVLRGAFCSYPRLAGAFGGISASTYTGDRVLHLGCGDGGLTKLLASQGMQVEAYESDPHLLDVASKRGLAVQKLLLDDNQPNSTIRKGALGGQQSFQTVLSYSESSLLHVGKEEECSNSIPLPWGQASDVDEIWRVLKLGGRFAQEHKLNFDPSAQSTSMDTLDIAVKSVRIHREVFKARGFFIEVCSAEERSKGVFVRLIVRKPGLPRVTR